jgi:hypothetical protein
LAWRGVEGASYRKTNLARTGAIDRGVIAQRVFEICFRYLLEHSSELPDGFMCKLDEPMEDNIPPLRKQHWLEEYSALCIYELARNGWHYELKSTPESN